MYLVQLSDSERVSVLNMGRELYDAARADGLAEWSESEISQFAQYLWKLQADGSVTFEDYAAATMPGDAPHRRAPYVGLTYNDLSQAANITVTSQGRIAAQTARPTFAINITDLTVLLSAVEDEIAASDATDDVKDEARSRVRQALGGVGSGAVGEVLGAAFVSALRALGGGL